MSRSGSSRRWRLADDFYCGAEDVARAALRANEISLGILRCELLAQPAHLRVDRTVVDLVVMQPRATEKLVAGQDALRRREKCGEQVEFAVGERHVLAARRRQTANPHIELITGEAVRANLLQAIGHRLLRAAAPQQRADACEQFARREWLGEVIVGAELESHDAVGLFLAPSDDD